MQGVNFIGWDTAKPVVQKAQLAAVIFSFQAVSRSQERGDVCLDRVGGRLYSLHLCKYVRISAS